MENTDERQCATRIAQSGTNYWTGEPEYFEICGHPQSAHTESGCTVALTADAGNGGMDRCRCQKFEAADG
jgi:hypothetical protein